jgi:hypothetical protein
VELFTTIGKVARAEIQYEPNGRSRGTGVVEFEQQADCYWYVTSRTLIETSLTLRQPSSLATSTVVGRSVLPTSSTRT